MNNNIKYFILGLAVLGGLTACNKQLTEEPQALVNTHRVYFSSATAETRTGITIADGTMTPDWRKTQEVNVHLFEIGSSGYVEGEDVEITLSEGDKVAHFKADFPTDMTIIVDPSKKNSPLRASNEANAGPYTYAAIVAQATESAYIVPAVQHPDTETLIDPDADFLIGYSRKSYDAAHNWEEDVVDLYFDRPVALGRIIISSFEEGEKVKSVVIKAPGLSGSAAYTAIDFENATVTFTPDEAAEGETAALTLDYGAGAALADDGTFGAYFVALPGKAQVSEVVVSTDKWVYTKTVGKEIAFSKDSFKNLTLNLASATKEAAAPTEIKWYKASVLEDGIDYIIVSEGMALQNNEGSASSVSVEPEDGIITFDAAVDPTIVWTATAKTYTTEDDGVSGSTIAGHFTLTNDGQYLLRNSSDILLGEAIPSSKPKYAVWDYDGTYLRHESSSTMTFYCYYDSKWTSGYTQNGAAPGSSIKTAQIYTSRAPQELVFTPAANAEYDLSTSEWTVAVPTLSGAQTSVSYALSEDSNPAVATVDADGTVHPLSRGTVTVVATAAGNDQYQAATAIYTLRVVDSSVTTNTYYKVTSTSDLTVGDQYLLVYEGGSKVFNPILDGSVFSKATANALDAEISSNTIISDSFVDSHLTLESGYYLKVEKYGNYLYPNVASSRGVLSAESAASHALNVSIGSNGVASIIAQSGTYYLVWSTSSNYFSSNTEIEGQYSTGICLYKLDDGRQPQAISFNPTEVNYDMAGSDGLVKPILSDAIGTVTYSSSNEEIASVEANSGDVTVHGRGTVEITATAAGDSQYRPGSASYTLIITDSSIIIPTWYKAEEIEAGETYLIVSGGYALQNNGGSAAAIAVEVSDGVIVYDAPESVIFTATASSGKFTFKNNGQYMQRGGSSGSYTPSFSSSQSSYYQWSYDSANSYLTASGSSTYYVYYSSGNNRWSMSSSSGSSHTTALYSTNPPRQAQALSFNPTSVDYDIAGSTAFTAPSLSGAQTTITYSSSKPAVATVDAETGAVLIVGVGTTTITASAEGTTEYKPATANYTIHVTDSSTPTTTKRYVLASTIEDGKDYIIVSSGYALKNENGSVASVAVTPVEGVLEFSNGDDENIAWTAAHVENVGSGTSGTIAGEYTFSNGSYRFSSNHSGNNSTLQFVKETTSVDKYAVWYIETYNEDTYLYHVSRSDGYFAYYDGAWKMTYVSSSTTPSSTQKPTQLYVEE